MTRTTTSHPLVFLLLASLMFNTACSKKEGWQGPPPEEQFEAFLLSWIQDEPAKAWEMIAKEDRDVLLKDYKAAKEAQPDLKPWDMMLTRKMISFYSVVKMETEKPLAKDLKPGARTTLLLQKRDGTKERATLSWDGKQWFVVLDLKGRS